MCPFNGPDLPPSLPSRAWRISTQIHTPDSSRYWLADSYESRLAAGQEPQNIDKEFLRLWFRERCDPYKDKVRARIGQQGLKWGAGTGGGGGSDKHGSSVPFQAMCLPCSCILPKINPLVVCVRQQERIGFRSTIQVDTLSVCTTAPTHH